MRTHIKTHKNKWIGSNRCTEFCVWVKIYILLQNRVKRTCNDLRFIHWSQFTFNSPITQLKAQLNFFAMLTIWCDELMQTKPFCECPETRYSDDHYYKLWANPEIFQFPWCWVSLFFALKVDIYQKYGFFVSFLQCHRFHVIVCTCAVWPPQTPKNILLNIQ